MRCRGEVLDGGYTTTVVWERYICRESFVITDAIISLIDTSCNGGTSTVSHRPYPCTKGWYSERKDDTDEEYEGDAREE